MFQFIRNRSRAWAMILLLAFVATSCASTTVIRSNPSDASLYINGERVGNTPYEYQDTKLSFSQTYLRLEKEGYDPVRTVIIRDEKADVGAIVAGFFVFVPWLWFLEYKGEHYYELRPSLEMEVQSTPVPVPQEVIETPPSPPAEKTAPQAPYRSKADRLRELKSLLDDKVITQKEYDEQKKLILESDEKW